MNPPIIYIVIPAYNESRHIARTIADVHAHGYHTIVVVDDGSADQTSQVASSLVTAIRHPVQRGYGAALTTGTHYALEHGADVIVHFDADGQHRGADIDRVVSPVLNGTADIVFGSRYLQHRSRLPFTKQYLIHKPALLVQRCITGLSFTDIHNGFRALSRTAALKLVILHDGMAYSSEIISEMKRLQLRYLEVPVTIAYEEYGQGFLDGIKIYWDLIMKKLSK